MFVFFLQKFDAVWLLLPSNIYHEIEKFKKELKITSLKPFDYVELSPNNVSKKSKEPVSTFFQNTKKSLFKTETVV